MNNIGFNKLYDTNVSEKILVNNLSYESIDSITNIGLVNNYEIILKNFNSNSNNSSNYKNKRESDLQGLLQFNSKLPLRKIGKNFDSLLTPILWLNLILHLIEIYKIVIELLIIVIFFHLIDLAQ